MGMSGIKTLATSLLLSLFLVSAGMFGTVSAEAADRLCEIVKRMGNDYDTYRFGEDYDNMGISKVMSDEEIKQGILESMAGLGKAVGYNYEVLEPVMIDGVPWQESKYAEIIIHGLDKDPTSLFKKYPDLYYFIKDKRFNGMGAKIVPLVKQGKSVEEITEILLSSKSPDPGKVPGNPTPGPAFEGTATKIVLHLNKRNYLLYKGPEEFTATLDSEPFLYKNTTMVPLKGVVDKFGAQLEWVKDLNQVIVRKNDKTIVLTVSNQTAIVDGKQVRLDVPPRIKSGRTFIPLRFVSEGLGLDVEWDNADSSITIN